jgi:hypothetical protein
LGLGLGPTPMMIAVALALVAALCGLVRQSLGQRANKGPAAEVAAEQ